MAKAETTKAMVRAFAPSEEDLAQLEKIMLAENPLEYEIVTDPAQVSRELRMQLMYAEDDDALEAFGDATSWGELEGVPIQINGWKVNPSTVEGGSGFYFVVFGTRMDDGESLVLTTGSDAVMAQIFNLTKRGQIPGAVRILEVAEKETKRGYKPHKLVSTPEEIERRKAERVEARDNES